MKVSFQEEYLDFEDLGILLEHILVNMKSLSDCSRRVFNEKPTYLRSTSPDCGTKLMLLNPI